MQPNVSQRKELQLRILTALALGIVGFITIWYLPWWGLVPISMIMAGLMLKEWDNITSFRSLVAYGVGLAYVLAMPLSLLAIHGIWGKAYVVWLICVIAGMDIGAYAVGKKFGKHKMAPKVSPGKTWEGLVGGLFTAMIVAVVIGELFGLPGEKTVFAGGLLALTAQLGDLYISLLKRKRGVKDSGKLLPGHGGILDRVDGWMPTFPLCLLLLMLGLL